MKRTWEFVILGIVGLLLSVACAYAPAPFAVTGAPGMQQPHPYPVAAANKEGEGLALTAPPSPRLSRIDHPSLRGIATESLIPAFLDAHGIDIADSSATSAHEIGFDQFRRAPPSRPQH